MISKKKALIKNDMSEILSHNLPWDRFRGKTILITGINSMFGAYMVHLFIELNRCHELEIKIIGLTRSSRKSEELFSENIKNGELVLLVQDVTNPICIAENVDYIFHFAGNASPVAILNDPVGIMTANIIGGFNVFELARRNPASRVVLASTREVYGNFVGSTIGENDFGALNPLDYRSCYPESKRALETIAKSYNLGYGVDFVSARIAHAYGPGMKLDNDGRVMSDFLNNAVTGKDIIINSSGEALRAFIYLSDAIAALLYIALLGNSANAYNLSNENEEYSIKDLAKIIADIQGSINILVKGSMNNLGYCSYKRTPLDTSKLTNLGFKPIVNLRDGLKRTLSFFT